jgi:hypothetical protein
MTLIIANSWYKINNNQTKTIKNFVKKKRKQKTDDNKITKTPLLIY